MCLGTTVLQRHGAACQSSHAAIVARVTRIPLCVAMAPKAKGGAGHKAAQDYVSGLWQQGLDEATVRQQLREDGYKAGRISQLIKATRPAQGQARPVAAAPTVMAKPAAADHATAAKAKPSAASSASSREAGKQAEQ